MLIRIAVEAGLWSICCLSFYPHCAGMWSHSWGQNSSLVTAKAVLAVNRHSYKMAERSMYGANDLKRLSFPRCAT